MKGSPEEIMARAFLLLVAGAVGVSIILAFGMYIGSIDEVIGAATIGGLIGGDIIIGLASILLRYPRNTEPPSN